MTDSPQVDFYAGDVEAAARFYRQSSVFAETFRMPQHGRQIVTRR